jgi:Zn-dependent peptidase ImmA (M78 family)
METVNEKARIGSARNLAMDLVKKCKIKEAPVSLRTVIAVLQDSHNLGVYPSANFSDKLSGILVTIEDETSRRDEIHFNQNHNWHRRRFSIAHEIGHLLFNTSHSSIGSDFYGSRSTDETEANQFASELLIPLSILKADLKKGRTTVKDLAWKYIVSEEAMGWKISTSNLLKHIL